MGRSSFITSKNSQLGSVITTKMPITLNNEKGLTNSFHIAISMSLKNSTTIYHIQDYKESFQKLDLPDTYFEIGGRRLNLP